MVDASPFGMREINALGTQEEKGYMKRLSVVEIRLDRPDFWAFPDLLPSECSGPIPPLL
jgi:hypothetical protein